MAKNAELFNNLCNFMKYFLNEVLPENEPTDLIRDSVKELLLALIKYTKLINYDISPIVLYSENNCSFVNLETQHQMSHSKSQLNAKENVTVSVPDSFDNNKLKINIKEDDFSENIAPSKVIKHETSMVEKSDEDNKPNAETEELIDGSGSSSDEEGSSDAEDSTSSESSSDIEKDEASNNEIMKNTFLNDSDVSKITAVDLKPGPSLSEAQISEKFVNIKLSLQASGSSSTDIIPLEFIELNECLMEKLISNAYYCWECGFSVAHLDYLTFHIKKHNNSSENSKSKLVAVEICSACSFVAAVPQEMTDQFIKYHKNHLHKLPSGKENYAFHLALVQSSFKKKFNKDDILPNFLGICLLCDAVFETPLEWNSHICEFQHLQTHVETVISCSRCCIVILGLVQEFSVHNYLGISDHINFCRAIKYSISGLHKI